MKNFLLTFLLLTSINSFCSNIIYDKAGDDLYKHMEKNIYPPERLKDAAVIEKGIFKFKGTGNDHIATPFIKLKPANGDKKLVLEFYGIIDTDFGFAVQSNSDYKKVFVDKITKENTVDGFYRKEFSVDDKTNAIRVCFQPNEKADYTIPNKIVLKQINVKKAKPLIIVGSITAVILAALVCILGLKKMFCKKTESKIENKSNISPKRKRLFKFMAISFSLIIIIILGELLSSIYGYITYGELSVSKLMASEWNNIYIVEESNEVRTLTDLYYPHPFLGYVFRDRGGKDKINPQGFWDDKDFLPVKPANKFVILLTGGSVAYYCGQKYKDCKGSNYIEDALNSKYDFSGKEVVVLNGAIGGWRQPQQAICMMLYSDIIDAVVTVDGYNEFMGVSSGNRTELPFSAYDQLNPFTSHSYAFLINAWASAKLLKFQTATPVIKHSHIVWLVMKTFRGVLRNVFEGVDHVGMSKNRLFEYPKDWNMDKRFDYNCKLYKKYILSIHAIAGYFGLKDAFFIQPVPVLYKKLTPMEKKNSTWAVGREYGKDYQRMINSLLELKNVDIPIYSIAEVFKDIDEEIYADDIHCYVRDEKSPGNKIISEAIVEHLAKEWNLKNKSSGNNSN